LKKNSQKSKICGENNRFCIFTKISAIFVNFRYEVFSKIFAKMQKPKCSFQPYTVTTAEAFSDICDAWRRTATQGWRNFFLHPCRKFPSLMLEISYAHVGYFLYLPMLGTRISYAHDGFFRRTVIPHTQLSCIHVGNFRRFPTPLVGFYNTFHHIQCNFFNSFPAKSVLILPVLFLKG
jgi:hypothetical protein